MNANAIARIIANFVIFLEHTDEDQVELDTAVRITEELATDMEALDLHFRRELATAFAVIAPDYKEQVRDSIRNIPSDFGLFDDQPEGNDPSPSADRYGIG